MHPWTVEYIQRSLVVELLSAVFFSIFCWDTRIWLPQTLRSPLYQRILHLSIACIHMQTQWLINLYLLAETNVFRVDSLVVHGKARTEKQTDTGNWYCIAGNVRSVHNFAFFEGRAVNAQIKNYHAVFHMQTYWWVWFPGIETWYFSTKRKYHLRAPANIFHYTVYLREGCMPALRLHPHTYSCMVIATDVNHKF